MKFKLIFTPHIVCKNIHIRIFGSEHGSAIENQRERERLALEKSRKCVIVWILVRKGVTGKREPMFNVYFTWLGFCVWYFGCAVMRMCVGFQWASEQVSERANVHVNALMLLLLLLILLLLLLLFLLLLFLLLPLFLLPLALVCGEMHIYWCILFSMHNACLPACLPEHQYSAIVAILYTWMYVHTYIDAMCM